MPDTAAPDEAVRAATWRLASPIAVLCLCVGYPLLLAALTRSLTIPHNDSWAYARIAQHYAQSGSIELVGWNCSAVGSSTLWTYDVSPWQ
jgi:hypothetical protein